MKGINLLIIMIIKNIKLFRFKYVFILNIIMKLYDGVILLRIYLVLVMLWNIDLKSCLLGGSGVEV